MFPLFAGRSRSWDALVKLCIMWHFKDPTNNELDSWKKFLYMTCPCSCGSMKASAMIATTEESMGTGLRGIPPCDHRLLIRGTRYSAIPIVSVVGVHDVYIAEGNMNGERFTKFVQDSLLTILMPFNGTNPCSIVIMDNASIHHVDEIADLIETQTGAKLCYLPPYSPDLNPIEGVFSQAKRIMKLNDKLIQATTAPRAMLAMIFGMISTTDCCGHISHCGYF